MMLGELIKVLRKADPNQVVPMGFAVPHSYRGSYDNVAFEPMTNTTVREMLAAARSALGKTFYGYKGGEYRMDKATDVYLANYGDVGEGIGLIFLAYMLGHEGNVGQLAQRRNV